MDSAKKIIYSLLLPFLFGACFNKLFAQLAIIDSNYYNNNFRPKHYLKPAALIAPSAFLLYGGLKPILNGIQDLDNNIMTHVQDNHPGFHTNAADYIMWIPSASLYCMDALKVKTVHVFREHLILDAGSIVIAGALGYGMRLITRNVKVYNERGTKFPSGHTANAFRGAEILHQELNETNKLLSYSGYVVATAVGVLRIYDKDHLLSEVISGAGLGLLSAKITYWIFDKVKHKRKAIMRGS